MDVKIATLPNGSSSSYHHQRAPRTPESYFNVPESIALLNIVKSERIQSAFQSNRKNHASVWEMVAEVLNRFSSRKRSAKQCCNRYENLKKIYTQLKKNPERHVRRNWPYMFLFKEIEEQRGECWGSANGKRLALITKNHKDLSYYHRRRQAAEYSAGVAGVLLHKDALAAAQVQAQQQHQHLLQNLANSTDSNSEHGKVERFMPNHFVETQLLEGNSNNSMYDDLPLHFQAVVQQAAAAARKGNEMLESGGNDGCGMSNLQLNALHQLGLSAALNEHGNAMTLNDDAATAISAATSVVHNIPNAPPSQLHKDDISNGPLHSQQNGDNNITLKSEPLSDGEFNPDDITLMQTNYNGSAQNFYPRSIDPNMFHPNVIVDTDNLSECSSSASILLKSKRKLSTTTTDGAESTNYELIEYLKRREKRDEEMLQRMDAREERLIQLLERTVVAIEALAATTATTQKCDIIGATTNSGINNTAMNISNNSEISCGSNITSHVEKV